ncbi:MAG: electron transfer flavoprotein subunit alpha/FixB family protein [Acidimicrobiia bacterium]|nr:electron transfer flavoprotein subunit alpha/FixB family protein [Acidimicrobiia bacterium]MCY4433715.1 electron transfer flavoprotein subunit alpha/FixB family protein [bacterium]
MLLVVLEHDRGSMDEAAREALTFGRGLATQMGVPLHGALIGADNAELVSEAGAYGAEAVYTVAHEVLADFGPEAWGETAAELVRRLNPEAVLAGGSERGNEIMAQVAARLDLPLVANCIEVQPDNGAGEWTMTRQQWGGSLLEDARLDSERPLLTTGLHAVAAERAESPVEPTVEAVVVELDQSLARTMVKDRVVLEAGVTLSTAPVVIGGGRGVGSPEAFAPLEELAAMLGGRVGCSRAVTNNGWRPHSDQVGQTGTRITPEIYIASGISGAIQHWVGAKASKHILAINIDPEANMVVKADWAVIADLHEMIPAITEEIKRRRA